MSLDHDPFYHARMERHAYLAVAVFLGYEYLLQFSNEVELFWQKRWSFGKCIFLWSRYYSLAFNFANCVMFMNEHPTFDFCTKFFHWQNTGAALQIITTHIILELRIYAMYGSSKYILALCAFLTATEVAVYGVMFGYPASGIIATNQPAPGLFICADADPPHKHWVTWFWLTIIVIEFILLSLSMYKGWTTSRCGLGSGLMRTLQRDSVLYFVVIFIVYVMNMTLWFLNIITLDEFGTGFSFTISTVLANRLLISVRQKYYRFHNLNTEWPTFTSMRFQSGEPGPSAQAETIGMTTFDFGATEEFERWDELSTNEREDLNEWQVDKFSEARGF